MREKLDDWEQEQITKAIAELEEAKGNAENAPRWDPELELRKAIQQRQERVNQLKRLYDLLDAHKVWYWVEQNPSDSAAELLFELMCSL